MKNENQQETIEQKVGRAVLQQTQTVNVGKKAYTIAPPSTATLILISEEISNLPKIKMDSQRVVEESLAVAKDCQGIGDIVATMILGARRSRILSPSYWLYQHRHKALARELLTEATPSELHELLARLLQNLQLGDFFGLTTFLVEINLMRPTKVEKTTVYGQ